MNTNTMNNGLLGLPKPGSTDWINQITVHLSSSKNNNNTFDEFAVGGDIQPLPFNGSSTVHRTNSQNGELQDMLHSIMSNSSVTDPLSSQTVSSSSPYLNVGKVEILVASPSDNGTNGGAAAGTYNNINEMLYIYSLGLVFYQLFSGGEDLPPDIIMEPPPPLAMQENDIGVQQFQAAFFDDLNVQEDDIDDALLSLFDDDDNDDEETKRASKKKSIGPSSTHVGNAIAAATMDGSRSQTILDSMDGLKLKGVPASLCNLIGNMIDSINGDLSGEEAYRTMSDVKVDLQLMIDKPNQFLSDIEIDKLAVSGLLQLDEYELGRDDEFLTLQGSYARSISGGNECGVIIGPSGIGKSVLANRLGSFVTAAGGLFLSGKFDQMKQPTPFAALASAFNKYCDEMASEWRSAMLEVVSSKLRAALGMDARYLVKIIPKLSGILGDGDIQPTEAQDCVDAQKRLQYLLCQFVDIIGSFSGAPIILFLDDVQWADKASISVIQQLLMSSGSSNTGRQFYFLASCRNEGMINEHPFKDMLTSIHSFGVNTTTVTLTCFDNEAINTMISDVMCLSPRLTRSLSEIIYHKSGGNPLFFSQLMLSLNRDGLVKFSLSRRRWTWDEEQIQSTKLPDDVATFLSCSIQRLPAEVREALFTLACFGASSDCFLISSLEDKLGSPLIAPLDIAVTAGLLDKIDSTYRFGHDWLQEAAYHTVIEPNRPILHFRYGVLLVPSAIDFKDDNMLFTAAHQINMGGPAAVEDAEQSVLVANLNLTASLKAMEMSDFVSAHSFADHGITFLRKGHWKDHYDLSLRLFETASRCCLVTGDVVTLKILSEQIERYAKTFSDKLNSKYNNVVALAFSSKLPESCSSAISVLSELGEELPDSYAEQELKFHIKQTKIILEGYTDQDLIGFRRMDDHKKIMAMKFYARLLLSYQLIKPDSQPIVILKMIQLTMGKGMSPVSPIAFVFFGQLLARQGDVQDGYLYTQVAHKMLEQFGTKEIAGEVIAVSTQIKCFVDPVQVALEAHADGHTVAMAAGDTNGALLNSIVYVATMSWAGTKLRIVKKEFDKACRLMEECKHITWLAHIIPLKTLFQELMGLDEDTDIPTSTNALVCEEAARELKKTNAHAMYTYYFQTMVLHLILRDYDQLHHVTEKYFEFNLHSWSLLFIHTAHAFYSGLAAFWIYRKTNNPVWAERGHTATLAMQK